MSGGRRSANPKLVKRRSTPTRTKAKQTRKRFEHANRTPIKIREGSPERRGRKYMAYTPHPRDGRRTPLPEWRRRGGGGWGGGGRGRGRIRGRGRGRGGRGRRRIVWPAPRPRPRPPPLPRPPRPAVAPVPAAAP